MARKTAVYSKKKNRKATAHRGRSRRGKRDFRHLRELGGLALIATGFFLVPVLYIGWSGGLVGAAMESALCYLFGVLAYLGPLLFLGAGVKMIFPDMPWGSGPFKAGLSLLLAALFLLTGADTFSLLGNDAAHTSFFNIEYISDHGGVAGESLYWATSFLIGDVGSTIAAVFLILAAVLLITGASVKAVLESSGSHARKAAGGARRSTRQIGQTLARKREGFEKRLEARRDGEVSATTGAEPAAVFERPALSEGLLQGEAGSSEPLNGAITYPDMYSEEAKPEPGVDEMETVMEMEIEPGNEKPVQAELFPRNRDAEMEAYIPPTPDMLLKSKEQQERSGDNYERVSRVLVETLSSFGIEATMAGMESGPRVTRYELQLAPGIKVSKVSNLKNDIAYALATTDIRILAPIPGKSAVGVEVPNIRPNMVTLGDIYRDFPTGSGPLMVWLGKDIAGKPVYADLAQMPHLLVAGTTGSGKSGSINCMISSILLRCSPDDVRMILIDPKRVELSHFQGIPQLLTPVVTVMKEAANVLANLITEMESRYSQMQLAKARQLDELNRVREQRGQKRLPYILLVVDELADLMMVSPKEVEDAIIRLAQKARAVGIHLVLATQRPSVDVITGMIKANVPSRIAFAVTSQTDSRVILDVNGAESLLGQGDMLFMPLGSSKLQRIQGAFISQEEIKLLTDRCKAQREPQFRQELLEGKEGDDGEELQSNEDELLVEAMELIVSTGTASVSFLQRRLRVGYTRAGRLIDMLEKRGVISGYEGSKPRRVLMDEDDLEHLLARTGGGDATDTERGSQPAEIVVGSDD